MAETVVKIDNLVKRYKELIALDHFDLEIKKGEKARSSDFSVLTVRARPPR